MASRLRSQLTYANVVSTLCLFILLGGAAYAAAQVTGRNVVDGSLTGRDVKDRSLKPADFRAGALPEARGGPRAHRGRAGLRGSGDLPARAARPTLPLRSGPSSWASTEPARGSTPT